MGRVVGKRLVLCLEQEQGTKIDYPLVVPVWCNAETIEPDIRQVLKATATSVAPTGRLTKFKLNARAATLQRFDISSRLAEWMTVSVGHRPKMGRVA
jgi:hypothetical protein